MSTPEIIKLSRAGESLTMQVTACGPLKMGQYPEVEFEGMDGYKAVAVRVPQKSADRQLDRLGLTYTSAVSKILTIYRAPNGQDASKPFWNIDVVGDAPARPAAQHAQPLAQNQAIAQATSNRSVEPTQHEPSGAALYEKITRYALDKILPLYAAKGIPVTMEGTAAICATMYIQASKHA